MAANYLPQTLEYSQQGPMSICVMHCHWPQERHLVWADFKAQRGGGGRGGGGGGTTKLYKSVRNKAYDEDATRAEIISMSIPTYLQ